MGGPSDPASTRSATAPRPWRGYAAGGYLLIAATFGVLGGGAGLVHVDSALIAPGTLVVASSRKVVEHLEGGIVSEVLVHEGDSVAAGQVLFRFSDVAARTEVGLLQGQLAAGLALQARLDAEQRGSAAIAWPAELLALPPAAGAAAAMTGEAAQFDDRRQSLAGQAAILSSRADQKGLEADGFRVERASAAAQLRLVRAELVGVGDLLDRKLVQLTRFLALQREEARLDGLVQRSAADGARSVQQVAELRLQARHAAEQFQEDVSTAAAAARQRVREARGKLAVALDVLDRTVVRAPAAGSVQLVRVGGPGQVVRPGETLLELVPAEDRLRVEARVPPAEIGELRPGQVAEIRFPAFPSRAVPLILGRVISVSGDRLLDEATHQPFFLAIVSADQADLPPPVAGHLRPGLPAEVIVPQGRRSVMSFLTDPLSTALRGTFLEH